MSVLNRTLLVGLAAGLSLSSSRAAPRISEFMADNKSSLADADGDFSDWIEIHNPDATPVSLAGYHLTDNPDNPDKWTFPAVTLEPGAYLVVFASEKDRTAPAAELHTNFQLSADGEYLALVAPDGVTVVSGIPAASLQYPPQIENQSYGLSVPGAGGAVNLTPAWGSPGNYTNVIITGIRTASQAASADNMNLATTGAFSQYYLWFDFSSRLNLLSPGDTVTSATLQWRGNCPATVSGSPAVDSKLGIFPVPDDRRGIDTVATGITGQEMVNYYGTHTPAAEFQATKGTAPTVTWDVAPLVQGWLDNPATPRRGQIMILNSARPMLMDWATDGTAKPVLTLNVNVTSDPGAPPAWSFFPVPTPGQTNGAGMRAGPNFIASTQNPPQPVSGPLTITAHVRPANGPVAGVKAWYRRVYTAENMLTMTDNGTGGDAVAGDFIWTAVIPAEAVVAGEMVRWRFAATDSSGTETKEPAFRDPVDSHEYFGTVGHDPELHTNLPVVHWFTSNAGGAGTAAGSRGSVYYAGEFYDNVLFNIHGQSTAGFPKKSYNLDFNRTQRFQWNPDAPRVADIDLLTNWADKSKVRHVLAYEIMRESGVAAHFAFTVRVEQNGNFFSTADFVEDGDDIYLERAGLNKDGALYKVYENNLDKSAGNSGNAGVEKKNRKTENNADLQALIDGLSLTGTALNNYLYDNIDIPKCVSLFAACSVVRNIDMHSKNWYIYRDTGVSNEWAILPWDLDLSAGRVWNTTNTYFDNAIYVDSYIQTGSSRLGTHLFANPAIRSMIMRRIRTVADQFLQPPPEAGTLESTLYYERRLNEQSALIDPPSITPSDARRDFEKWGSWLQAGATVPYTNTNAAVETMAEAVTRFKTEYLPGRRSFIYNTQIVGRGGELPLPQNRSQTITYTPILTGRVPCRAIVPTSTTPAANWTGLPGFEPYDDSTWLSGITGVGYERGTGVAAIIGINVNTQMQANNSVFVRIPFEVTTPLDGFDILELRMKYDDGFVAYLNGVKVASQNAPASPVWNSAASALHEADPASFDTFNITAHKAQLKMGPNILALHGLNDSVGSSDMIVLPELHAGVLGPLIEGEPVLQFGTVEFNPASGNQDEEYIQINNPAPVAVDISGWKITGGVEHTFAPGTVLPVGGTVYVSPNVAAFRARTVSPKGGEGRFVQGAYSGHLSSFSETLTLRDAAGTVNASTTYTGNPSDAQKYLVISEVMYHPEGDGLAEYVEIMNISPTVTVNLAGIRFTAGIDFDFTGSDVTSLPPGGRALVVRDTAAFTAVHGAGKPVAGVFASQTALSNSGEMVKLEDAANGTIREFTYTDADPWPAGADDGYSMVLIAPASNPDHSIPSNWRSSVARPGTPGGSDALPYPASPLGDANGNGVADLVDFAFGNTLGTGPIAPVIEWRPFTVSGQPVTLPVVTYPVSIGSDGAVIHLEVSTDMNAWPDASAQIQTVGTSYTGDGRMLVSRVIHPPLGSSSRLFIRFLVTGP